MAMTNVQQEIRSALRALVRAQRITFQGDIRARQAARDLNRGLLQPAIDSSTSPEEKNEAILGARQVARYLMENVLQGVPKSDAEVAYQLRFTPHTALGDNASISKAKPAPSLEEIKSTMNKGESSSSDAPKNTRTRRKRSKATSESTGDTMNISEAGSVPSN